MRAFHDNDDTEHPSLTLTLVAGILALAVAMGIGRFAYTPILPTMQTTFSLTDNAVGLLASSNYLGYLAGAVSMAVFPVGAWRIPLLRANLLIVVLSTAAMAATTTYVLWLMLRFVTGVSSAMVFVLASGIVLNVLRRRAKLSLSGWLYSGVGIGIAISGVVVLGVANILLLNSTDVWLVDWVSLSVVAALLVAVSWLWLPKQGSKQGSTKRNSTETVTSNQMNKQVLLVLGLLSLAYFLEGVGYIVTGTFLVKIVGDTLGSNDVATGAWILVGLAAIPSSVLWSKLASYTGYVAVLIVAYLVQATGIILPVIIHSAWAVLCSAILFGGTITGITALTVTFAGQQAIHRTTQAASVVTAAFGAGQVLGPIIAARLARGPSDFSLSLVVASAVVIMGSVVMLAIMLIAPTTRGPLAPRGTVERR